LFSEIVARGASCGYGPIEVLPFDRLDVMWGGAS